MKPTDEYVVCSLEDAETFAQKRNITVKGETVKPNYVAEAPWQPGYEDAVVAEPKPFFCGVYKSKPLTNEEITGIRMQTEGDIIAFARAIERRHGIK